MAPLRTPPQSICEKIDRLSARAESLEQQLIQAQRLATMGTLSMSLAHEFKNLLMVIMNHADAALASRNEESMQQALEKTAGCSDRASRMIRNMLSFAGSSDDHPRPVKTAELMENALALMARDPAKDGIELQRDYEEDAWVEGPAVEFTQVLLNLIVNARHAMDSGGRLTLRTSTEGDYALMEVADTGSGIEAEHMERIFDPFFTTKGDSGGTGLGLYLAREIVRRQGGEIAVVSRPGHGTTFTVYLPRTARLPGS